MAIGRSMTSTKKLGNVNLVECGPQETSSHSVSWNSTGSCLALASSDRMARLLDLSSLNAPSSTSTTASAREILTITGHTRHVLKVRFHPREANMLCTAAADTSVRLWDVRGATQRAVGQINVQHGQAALAVEWSPAVSSHILAVTERNGTVYIYDTRKLSPAANATTTTQRSNNNNSALCTYKLSPYIAETCIFSPSGQHLVAGCSKRGQGVAELRIWPWKENDKNAAAAVEQAASYPAHTGPIYSMQFSPNGKHLVTGGSDAIVGLFDTTTMCCEKTFTKRLKFIRSTVFSHDSQLLAIGTEEDGIEIADVKTGLSVGSVSMGHRPRSGGAEEIAWHPKEYIVACARTDIAVGGPPTPATVAKLTITS